VMGCELALIHDRALLPVIQIKKFRS